MATSKKESKEIVNKENFSKLLLESAAEAVKYTRGEGVLTEKKVSLIEEPAPYSKTKIKKIRLKLGVSQKVFASIFGESISAVQKWEQGNRNMSGSAKRLLSMLDKDPEKAFDLIIDSEAS